MVSSAQFHQYQVVGRALPTPGDEHPKIYRMKLWATNEVRAKSKFWSVPFIHLLLLWCAVFERWLVGLGARRYFLRKLKKVKKSNGQVLAINEVLLVHLLPAMLLCFLNSCGSNGFDVANMQ